MENLVSPIGNFDSKKFPFADSETGCNHLFLFGGTDFSIFTNWKK